MRPPLEKMLFPVQRPGESMRADWDLFFFISTIYFFQYYFYYFLTKKKEKQKKRRFSVRPTGHNFGHPLYRKQTFFKGGLTGVLDTDHMTYCERRYLRVCTFSRIWENWLFRVDCTFHSILSKRLFSHCTYFRRLFTNANYAKTLRMQNCSVTWSMSFPTVPATLTDIHWTHTMESHPAQPNTPYRLGK